MTDRIDIFVENQGNLAKVIENNQGQIKQAILCDNVIVNGEISGFDKSFNIGGENLVIAVKKN